MSSIPRLWVVEGICGGPETGERGQRASLRHLPAPGTAFSGSKTDLLFFQFLQFHHGAKPAPGASQQGEKAPPFGWRAPRVYPEKTLPFSPQRSHQVPVNRIPRSFRSLAARGRAGRGPRSWKAPAGRSRQRRVRLEQRVGGEAGDAAVVVVVPGHADVALVTEMCAPAFGRRNENQTPEKLPIPASASEAAALSPAQRQSEVVGDNVGFLTPPGVTTTLDNLTGTEAGEAVVSARPGPSASPRGSA